MKLDKLEIVWYKGTHVPTKNMLLISLTFDETYTILKYPCNKAICPWWAHRANHVSLCGSVLASEQKMTLQTDTGQTESGMEAAHCLKSRKGLPLKCPNYIKNKPIVIMKVIFLSESNSDRERDNSDWLYIKWFLGSVLPPYLTLSVRPVSRCSDVRMSVMYFFLQ